ncbi:hypothetical protein IAU59_003998 [Kwoniella sp. CBS 9459]
MSASFTPDLNAASATGPSASREGASSSSSPTLSPSSVSVLKRRDAHTPDRSRTGCVQCRSAKKKCSEERPICMRCAQRRVECTYDREIGVRHRNKRRRPLNIKAERERELSTPTSQHPYHYSHDGVYSSIPHTASTSGSTASPRLGTYSPYPPTTTSYPPGMEAHHQPTTDRLQEQGQAQGDTLASRPLFISTTSAIRAGSGVGVDNTAALLSPSAELRSWIEGGLGPAAATAPAITTTSAPASGPPVMPAVPNYGLGPIDTSSSADLSSSGFNLDQMLVEHLLQEFFSTSSSDISDLFPGLLNPSITENGPNSNFVCTKFVTDPAAVRQRLEQSRSQSPGPKWPISCYVPSSFPTSATKEELDLVRHFIEIQSPISIAVESEHNPLRKHVLPVALVISSPFASPTSPEKTGDASTYDANTNGREHAENGSGAPVRTNPAFYALLAAAATHRANLFVAAGKEEDPTLRRTASQSRAKAYTLAAEKMRSYALEDGDDNDKREQIDCAIFLLTYTAVLDGNSKLLPILYESYHRALSQIEYTSLSSRSRAFVSMCAMYETWYAFPTLATGAQPLKSLLDLVPPSERFAEPNLDGLFGVPGSICMRWLKAIDLVRNYHKAKKDSDPSIMIPICLQAEELDESIASDQRALLYSSTNQQAMPFGSTAGSADRIRQGEEIHYATLRVFVQREILGIRTEEDRIQRQVKMALGTLSTIRWGTETGLLIPLFVLAINSLGTDREVFRALLSRCCWKGSAGPRTVAAAAQEIWDRLNRGLEDDWRGVLLKYGGPILI